MTLTQTTTLHNGVQIPLVGLGVYKMQEGGEVEEAIQSALDVGYRHIDTASFYGNEEGVGTAIKQSDVPREELFVTTKIWNDEQGYDETFEAFQRSLDKLGLDKLDLYLVHWPIKGKFKDTWRAMEQLYHEGKVGAIGVSNFMPHHLDELMKDAEVKPMVNQIEFHPELIQQETRDYCKKHDIAIEAWSPLGRGHYFDAPILKQLAEKYNKTPAQIILRWDLHQGVITIPKSSKRKRQEENADIFDFKLTDDEIDKISALDNNGRIGPHPDEMGA
ncbi:aldo/keto reductase [Thalassobacillus sp. CUG 92003]|uniref:aldo/keto reductase n=1 Tax=Thalassobacillus sp. CUG 92003 TaxID=2736641 RepID=UPI0015E79A37|nr:aldo/keto reductase [Thalassobacillus sp. CUG 92003]